jgi:hypothetical protein
MAGTLQPSRSEGLWAQVGSLHAKVPHIVAEVPFGRGDLEGLSKLIHAAGYVWTRLDLSAGAGRLRTELCRCLVLEAVLGKTHRTEFLGGRLETWPWEPLTEAFGESRGYATGP